MFWSISKWRLPVVGPLYFARDVVLNLVFGVVWVLTKAVKAINDL